MMKMTVLLTALVLLNGCFGSRPAEEPEAGSLYTERLSRPRTERQLQRKELVLAVHDSIESSWEIGRLRPVLQKKQIKLKVIPVSDRDEMSFMVRSGRADLMAGAFSQKEVRSLHLRPVLPYTGSDGRSQFCFAVRHDDQILENLLGTAASGKKQERKTP